MGLKSLKLPTETQQIPGSDEPVTLHGITLPDLTQLVLHHGPAMRTVFDKMTSAVRNEEPKEPLGEPDVDKAVASAMGKAPVAEAEPAAEEGFDTTFLVEAMIRISPKLVGEVIALSAREPDAVEEASQLPFPVMLEALEKVFRVTFATEGGVKSFAETVIRVANSLTAAMATTSMEDLVPSLMTGSGQSEGE